MDYTEYDTRLAAYALIVEDDRVLLTWYNGAGGSGTPCWSLPGGGVDFEESVEAAIVREAREETGHEVALVAPLTTHAWTGTSRRSGRPFKSVRVVYTATVTGGTLGTLEVGGSTDHAAWVALADVASEPSVADIVVVALEARRAALA